MGIQKNSQAVKPLNAFVLGNEKNQTQILRGGRKQADGRVEENKILGINLYVHDLNYHVINFNFNNEVLFYFCYHISLFDQMVHLIMSLIKIKDLLL